MNRESFDFGILSTEELGETDTVNFLLGEDPIEDINTPRPEPKPAPKPETPKPTPKPGPIKEEVQEEENKEEDLDDLLGKEDEPNKKKKTAEPEEEDEDVNIYAEITQTLVEQGILTPGEEGLEINNAEELLTAFQQEKQMGASQMVNAFLDSKGEYYRQAFDAIFVNGVDPREYFERATAIEDYSNLDMDNERVQEQVYREYYKRMGWKDSRIDRSLQLARESGELADYSKEFQQELIEKNQQELTQKTEQEKQKKLDDQRKSKEYQQSIGTIIQDKLKTKDFDGIPVNEKTAQQVFNMLSKDAYRSGDKYLTEWDKFILDLNKPENHALKVKIALLQANNFDLSVIKKKAISEESKGLFGQLSSRTTKSKKQALRNEEDPFII